MNIEEAKAECNLWVQAKASINLVYDREDGKPHFISCDTTALEVVLSELEKKDAVINELEEKLNAIETYYDISDLEEMIKNDK